MQGRGYPYFVRILFSYMNFGDIAGIPNLSEKG
jgi:hypothetical protein